MSTPAMDWWPEMAERLREARQEAKRRKGHTVEDLADLTEELSGKSVAASTISTWERGEHMARVDYMYVVCRESGLSPHYVLTGDEPRRWVYRENEKAQTVLMALRQAVEESGG